MKTMKKILLTGCLLSLAAISAQEEETVGVETTPIENKIGTETIEKTYKVYNGKEVIRNSVKITTELSQEMKFSNDDMGKIDQDRVIPKTKITKTVLIDNDNDDAYDEKIIFSYMGNSKTDFTLVTNDDEILVGIEDGEDLNIIQSESITISNLKTNKEAYVFTNNSGEEVEFYIENYRALTKEKPE